MTDLDNDGFEIFQNVVDPKLLYQLIYYRTNWDRPDRGHDMDGRYYERYMDAVDWGTYWTRSLIDHDTVIQLEQEIKPIVESFLESPVWYHSDVSVVLPNCKTICPHVDTPHRHRPWNQPGLFRLGIQVAVPLQAIGIMGGSTGFWPGSHKVFWDIDKCYKGDYTQEFLKNVVQPDIAFGDIVIWDSRTLHSHMMNLQNEPRYLLLFNYVERTILEELIRYETDN